MARLHPTDPDWATFAGVGSTAPVVSGDIGYNMRGLPYQMRYRINHSDLPADVTCRASPLEINYRPDGALHTWKLGDYYAANGTTLQDPTTIFHLYDVRNRLRLSQTSRTEASDPMSININELNAFVYKRYEWDDANNLTSVYNFSGGANYPAGHKPEYIDISHDALYRVTGARYRYDTGAGLSRTDTAFDWRNEITTGSSDGMTPNNGDGFTHSSRDPMRGLPAPMLPSSPAARVRDLQWRYDWLGNMTRWDEDDPATTGATETTQFYERGLGRIGNGVDLTTLATLRPSALYIASTVPSPSPPVFSPTADRGGWLELTYGVGGNVTSMTVHARCMDAAPSTPVAIRTCYDIGSAHFAGRRDNMRNNCRCTAEQHYQFRWDELNRLHEARRYDRTGGTGPWTLAARQAYRYDAANERAIKHTYADEVTSSEPGRNFDRTTLYVYPGDFERRGVVRSVGGIYTVSTTTGTETQYLVAGNRIVWQQPSDVDPLVRNRRVTHTVTDLLGSTSGVIDIESAQLLSVGTYYPNGAQEQLWMQHGTSLAPEPLGFTGKEEDAELGLAYFGHRFLIPRAGRWASPDPLAVHTLGGGETLNSFHYVTGSLLQARDPDGLDHEYALPNGDTYPGPPDASDDPGIEEHVWYEWFKHGARAVLEERGLFGSADFEALLREVNRGNIDAVLAAGVGNVLSAIDQNRMIATSGREGAALGGEIAGYLDDDLYFSGYNGGRAFARLFLIASEVGFAAALTPPRATGRMPGGGMLGSALARGVQIVRRLARRVLREASVVLRDSRGSALELFGLAGGTGWRPGRNDLDWRGSGRGWREALSEAFRRTGVSRDRFQVSQWARDEHGKSWPVEWTGPRGAEVSIDTGHLTDGPGVPHVGYQTPGKRRSGGGARGHILLDNVPAHRSAADED